jgi:hypothetical protein
LVEKIKVNLRIVAFDNPKQQDHTIEREDSFRKFELYKKSAKEREFSTQVATEQQIQQLNKFFQFLLFSHKKSEN